MRGLAAGAALSLAIPVFALAQNTDHQYHAQGYFFLAGAWSHARVELLGSSSNSLQFGGGGEWLAGYGLGLGGELLRSTQYYEGAALDTWFGSINVSYHFGPSRNNRRVEPFVSGGYTLCYQSNTYLPHENGANFGVGLNVWLKHHTALRLEIRDDIGGQGLSAEFEPGETFYLRSSQHLVGFRIGVTFR